MKKLLSIIFATIICIPAFAETDVQHQESSNANNIQITVTVWDQEENEPLSFASVQQKGTTNGATTDNNGVAKLTVPANATIVVSYVGKEPMEKSASTNMRFDLKNNSTLLNEITIKACSMANGIQTVACENCTNPDQCDIHKCSGKCVVKACYKPCYELKNGKCVPQEVKGGTYTFENKQCKLSCNSGYTPDLKDQWKCTRDCLAEAQKTDPQAKKAEYDEKNVCQITDCNDKDGKKYVVVNNKCVEKERDCTDAELKAMNIPGAIAGTWSSKKGTCTPTACSEPQYEAKPKGGKCISVDDSDCDTKPANSKKSHRKYDEATGQVQCIVDTCQDGYRVSDDAMSCIPEKALSEEDANKRMAELKDNAQKMKEREQSTENKLLGAAGIGAVGIGGMNIASALSEKSADADAEQDMRAYLATFRCDYGQGRNITGGETNIELPGGNDLLTYTNEYKQLAQNLKIDKEALGMMPGIESEVVFDKAETGLYDNVGIGTQPGAFTSLSRALLDENSADAKAWAEQKANTASKLKTGLIVAGVGAVGSLAGNLAINHGKGDKSGNILNKWEQEKSPLKKLEDDINKIPPQKDTCPSHAPGSWPDCKCANSMPFNTDTKECPTCTGNQVPRDGQCVCPDDKPNKDQNGNCYAETVKPQCDTSAHKSLIADASGKCHCINGYTYDETNKTCVCQGANKRETNGTCDTVLVENNPIYINDGPKVLDAVSMFDLGKSTIRSDAKSVLDNFVSELAKSNVQNCTLLITGYTDPLGSETTNKTLSENRATAVKNYIQQKNASNNNLIANISAVGAGEQNCTCSKGKQPAPSDMSKPDYKICMGADKDKVLSGNDKYAPCRRVEVYISCQPKISAGQ